ncbi:hypothetical protein BDR07DRAFT_849174 [Suillus spraguei]|nr:hypothetical protein BDR07DRAFT_849174 [Suillus spraguei]
MLWLRLRYKDQYVAIWFASRSWNHSMNANLSQPEPEALFVPFYVITMTLSHMYMTALLIAKSRRMYIEWNFPSERSCATVFLFRYATPSELRHRFHIIYIADSGSSSQIPCRYNEGERLESFGPLLLTRSV